MCVCVYTASNVTLICDCVYICLCGFLTMTAEKGVFVCVSALEIAQ